MGFQPIGPSNLPGRRFNGDQVSGANPILMIGAVQSVPFNVSRSRIATII